MTFLCAIIVYEGDIFTFYAIYKYVCQGKLRRSVCLYHLPRVLLQVLSISRFPIY